MVKCNALLKYIYPMLLDPLFLRITGDANFCRAARSRMLLPLGLLPNTDYGYCNGITGFHSLLSRFSRLSIFFFFFLQPTRCRELKQRTTAFGTFTLFLCYKTVYKRRLCYLNYVQLFYKSGLFISIEKKNERKIYIPSSSSISSYLPTRQSWTVGGKGGRILAD
ncbi:hypothetical protein PUN28_002763 [Cardiocondyla obscurior]|uniref:Uncharacterized protein n=1 Tax=Cardiocondyla obscurior TaxID=286306 RepID=A0AAW2GW00_9HYME